MHDFQCTDPEQMYYKALADRTTELRGSEKEVYHMCDIVEEMMKEKDKETASVLLSMGKLPHEDIAAACRLSIDEVKRIEEELKPESA